MPKFIECSTIDVSFIQFSHKRHCTFEKPKYVEAIFKTCRYPYNEYMNLQLRGNAPWNLYNQHPSLGHPLKFVHYLVKYKSFIIQTCMTSTLRIVELKRGFRRKTSTASTRPLLFVNVIYTGCCDLMDDIWYRIVSYAQLDDNYEDEQQTHCWRKVDLKGCKR